MVECDNRWGNEVRALLFAAMTVVFAGQVHANSANISCGQPTKNGTLTVKVTFEDKSSLSWNVAGILKSDTPQQKAVKIRSAAPPTDARLVQDATSGTVAGGTVNTVSVTSVAAAKIKGIGFTANTTGEKDKINVFAALFQHRGLASLAGVATGVDDDGLQGLVEVSAFGVTATVNTSGGMTAAAIEDAIISQLDSGGVAVGLGNAVSIASDFPGLEGDGRLLDIGNIDANGLEVQSTDVGIAVDVSALVDASGTPLAVPVAGLWALMLLAVALAGTHWSVRRGYSQQLG